MPARLPSRCDPAAPRPEVTAPLPRGSSWIEKELADCAFSDQRLAQRFRTLLQQLGAGLGDSIP